MTEPSGSRRRRRRSRGLSELVSGRGLLTAIIVIGAIVVVAAGLSIALGGPQFPSESTSARPSASDFPPVGAPGRSEAVSFPPVATESAAASPNPSGSLGIRAARIRIDRLGIDLKIVEGDGIDAPLDKAAHFPGSGWPGGGTNIYIYAHAREGMFLSLWDVKQGDTVILTLVDGTERTYAVDKVLPRVPWDAIEYLAPTPTEQLTLQTSTSYYPTAPRFVVRAYPSP